MCRSGILGYDTFCQWVGRSEHHSQEDCCHIFSAVSNVKASEHKALVFQSIYSH